LASQHVYTTKMKRTKAERFHRNIVWTTVLFLLDDEFGSVSIDQEER
jgi:hypothetical protein